MAQMVVWGSLGLPAMGVTSILLNDFFARGKYSTVSVVVLLNLLVFGLIASWVENYFDYGKMMLCWAGVYVSIAVVLWLVRARSSLPRLRLGGYSSGCMAVFIAFVFFEHLGADSLKTSFFYASVSLATAGLAFYIGLRNRSSR
jgi:peptidoglycan biosynthesis protein MviN/MurJ (putative lipid II flippase)